MLTSRSGRRGPVCRGGAGQSAPQPPWVGPESGVPILLKRESYGAPRRVLRASLESMVSGGNIVQMDNMVHNYNQTISIDL